MESKKIKPELNLEKEIEFLTERSKCKVKDVVLSALNHGDFTAKMMHDFANQGVQRVLSELRDLIEISNHWTAQSYHEDKELLTEFTNQLTELLTKHQK